MRPATLTLTVFLFLFAAPGRAPAGEAMRQTAGPDGRPYYYLRDSAGQDWASPHREWLAQWVGQQNARLAGAARAVAPEVQNFGVSREHMPAVAAAEGRRWGPGAGDRTGGTPTPTKPDVFLTVVGPDAERVVAAWEANPSFAAASKALGDRLAVKSYPPGYPTNAGLKIEDGGAPDILIQDATGKELARYRSDPGAETIAGGLREADPRYTPGRPKEPPWSVPSLSDPRALGVLAFLGALLFIPSLRRADPYR